MRRLLTMVLVCSMACSSIVFGAQKEVALTLDGKKITLEQDIVYAQDRMMLPVRAMADVLGAEVTYDNATRTATVEKQMKGIYDKNLEPVKWKVSLGLDSPYLTLMDTCEMLLETKPLVVDNRAYLPLRELAEAMNLEVVWQAGETTDTVVLTSAQTPQVLLSPKTEFDWESMSMTMEWENKESVVFYAAETFWLEKWDGHAWQKIEPTKPNETQNTDTYSIPTGGTTNGKRERKFTFWQWEEAIKGGKYRVVVPYQYTEGKGEALPFFSLDQTAVYEAGTPTTYLAYGEFIV